MALIKGKRSVSHAQVTVCEKRAHAALCRRDSHALVFLYIMTALFLRREEEKESASFAWNVASRGVLFRGSLFACLRPSEGEDLCR